LRLLNGDLIFIVNQKMSLTVNVKLVFCALTIDLTRGILLFYRFVGRVMNVTPEIPID